MTAERERKLAEKMKERYPVDERVSQSNTKALAGCGIAAIIYDFIMLMYECLRENGNPIPELILLLVMASIIGLSKKKDKIVEKPQAAGKLLDTGTTAGARIKRIGMYLLDSLLLLGGIFAADFIAFKAELIPAEDRVLEDPRAAIIFFVVFFLFTLMIGERKAKKYNAYQKHLDDDENDLDD